MKVITKAKLMMVLFVISIGLGLFACGGGDSGDIDTPPGQESYPTGNQDFKIEDAENADPLNGYRVDGDGSNTLPESVDHSNKMPEVRSQGRTGSCTSWAVGYYGKSFQEAREEGWDPSQNAFSPSYLYAMQCRTYEAPWNTIKAWEILNRYGCAKWDTLPFEDYGASGNWNAEKENYANLQIPQEAHTEAKIFRCGEMANQKSLAQIKKALTNGPVVLSINYYDSPPQSPSPEENYMRYNPEKSDVGHAILCVGYDNAKFGSGALKFINSWGSQWAEDGFSWIRYSDIPKIVMTSISYKDIPNPNNPDDPSDVSSRPKPPTDVSATDDVGSYVDITWSGVTGAQYYRIFRAKVNDAKTYAEIGIAYQGNYRDYPSPGIQFYYAVVAVNDLGESEHFASEEDDKGHVDKGSAIGSSLAKPELKWDYNDSEGSHFLVGNIDPAATTMEVLISTASEGPWDSLGWIKPENFVIKWGDDSEYAHKKPFVRVRVANDDASSNLSDSAQVDEDIDNNVDVATITEFDVSSQASSILLRWKINEGNVDFFEIWRFCAASDEANDWIKLGYSDLSAMDSANSIYYEDDTALPGVPYYYVVVAIYQGAYGKLNYHEKPVQIEDTGTNLNLISFQYHYNQITNPTAFPEIVVRNDGATRVESYTIGIMAYDWNEDKTYLIKKVIATDALEAGSQHTLRINQVHIHSDYMDDHVYSWGLKVDFDDEIVETYEDDNILWSTDGWWLPSNREATAAGGDSIQGPQLGSTRPFSYKKEFSSELKRDAATGDDQYIIYNGPSIFHRPDFCNDHTK